MPFSWTLDIEDWILDIECLLTPAAPGAAMKEGRR
jgi:hypothetical protein